MTLVRGGLGGGVQAPPGGGIFGPGGFLGPSGPVFGPGGFLGPGGPVFGPGGFLGPPVQPPSAGPSGPKIGAGGGTGSYGGSQPVPGVVFTQGEQSEEESATESQPGESNNEEDPEDPIRRKPRSGDYSDEEFQNGRKDDDNGPINRVYDEWNTRNPGLLFPSDLLGTANDLISRGFTAQEIVTRIEGILFEE